jgi:hypothetical protein
MPKLSESALKAKIAELQKNLDDLNKRKKPAIDKISAIMAEHGLTLADLQGAAPKAATRGRKKGAAKPAAAKGKVEAKFRDAATGAVRLAPRLVALRVGEQVVVPRGPGERPPRQQGLVGVQDRFVRRVGQRLQYGCLVRARRLEQRERLVEIVNHDVKRLDRLITDITRTDPDVIFLAEAFTAQPMCTGGSWPGCR